MGGVKKYQNIYQQMVSNDDCERFQFYLKRTVHRYCSIFYIDSFNDYRKENKIVYKLCDNKSKEFMDAIIIDFCKQQFGVRFINLLSSQQFQQLVNQVMVIIFNNRLPQTQELRIPVEQRDQFIQETVESLVTYEKGGMCSFETHWLLKYRFSRFHEDIFFENIINCFLFYHFTSHRDMPNFVDKRCQKIKIDIKLEMDGKQAQIDYKN